MNEEESIGRVIGDIYRVLGRDTEIVITDSSKDSTPKIAREMGAVVLSQPPMGYGRALANSLKNAKGGLIATTDCDGTYPMEQFPLLLEKAKEYDVVSGSRLLGKGRAASMPLFNEAGNRAFALMCNALFGCRFSDVTTGMRVFRREVITSIDWKENIGLSIELLVKPHLAGFRITEVPISYHERIGATKLNPIHGGKEMLKSIVRMKAEEKAIRQQGKGGSAHA
jgi:glycosyltransferase involved in cell wall biosynthesis